MTDTVIFMYWLWKWHEEKPSVLVSVTEIITSESEIWAQTCSTSESSKYELLHDTAFWLLPERYDYLW